MKNKIISVVLSTAMVATLLMGCGAKAEEPAPAPAAEEVAEEAAEEKVAEEEVAEEETAEEETAEEAPAEGLPLEGVTLTFTGDAFNPYRIIDENGELSGLDADVLAALQEKLGFEYEFVEAEFTAVLTSLATGTADFGMTLTPKEERKEAMDFTQEYLSPKTGIGFLADSGISAYEDLAGKTIIAPSGTTFAETAYAIEGANVIEMENIPLGCEEVVAGRADAILCDSVQLTTYADEYNLDHFVVSPEQTGVEMLGNAIGFTKGSEYMPYFDEALTELKEEGTLTEIQAKWLGEENATVY